MPARPNNVEVGGAAASSAHLILSIGGINQKILYTDQLAEQGVRCEYGAEVGQAWVGY